MGFPQNIQFDPDFEKMLDEINDEIVAEDQARKQQAPLDNGTGEDAAEGVKHDGSSGDVAGDTPE